MPELPEVETVRRDLQELILDKSIKEVIIHLDRIVKNENAFFLTALTGNQFGELERIGKLLIFRTKSPEHILLIHLKMTGQLIYKAGEYKHAGGWPAIKFGDLPNKHTRAQFNFEDGSTLFFNDMRTFGYLRLINQDQLDEILSNYGPDPLHTFTKEEFLKGFKKRKTTIKAVLLNQSVVAGVGNIYADEICFDCGIRPDRPVQTLSDQDLDRVFVSTKKIIDLAVKHRGTSFRDYVDGKGEKGGFAMYAKVYGRDGQPCDDCGSVIEKSKVAQRGTHTCPICQK